MLLFLGQKTHVRASLEILGYNDATFTAHVQLQIRIAISERLGMELCYVEMSNARSMLVN